MKRFTLVIVAIASMLSVFAFASSGPVAQAVSPSHTATVAADEKPTIVYITRTGKKYHRGGCRYLKKSKIAIALSKAKVKYGACKVCKPPK